MTIRISIAALLFLVALLPSMAQGNETFEQYKKRKQQEFTQYRVNKQNEFDAYRRQKNEEFAKFVRQKWEAYKGAKPVPRPKEEDKPPVVVKDEERKKPIEDSPIPINEILKPPAPTPQPEPIVPIQGESEPTEKWVEFMVYGTSMKVRFGDELRFRLAELTEQDVANGWLRLSEKKYDKVVQDCLELRAERHLSDWAYLNMLGKMAEACMGKGNSATLLAAYVYSQSGYQMRLAKSEGQLRLLYGTEHIIYDKRYYRIDDVNYYPFSGEEKDLQICNVPFPKEKPLSLLIPQQQDFSVDKSAERTLISKRYPDMQVKVCVNKNLIAFCNSYPTSMLDLNFMTRWAMYANTPMEPTVKNGLYPSLREKLKDKSQLEAMERLLNWVQTALVYEYDDKVWGGDRAFFAEETLYYPYCDCEDRSILLSRLVRDLLGLKCILIYYPGHLAMAVRFTEDVKGDYIMLDGDKYVVCDPTYINAPVGKTMPKMDNKSAQVILLNR